MDDSNSALDVDGDGNVTNLAVEEKASTEVIDSKKKAKSSHSKVGWKVWTLFGAAVVAVVSLAGFLIAIIVTNNQGGNIDELPENTEPVTMEYTDVEIANELNKIQLQVYDMKLDEAQSYINKQIQKYRGTNLWPRLIIFKAWVYVNSNDQDSALRVADELDVDELDNELKLKYYDLLRSIYYIKNDQEKEKEYYDKYWATYDDMFGGNGVSDEDTIEESEITQPEGPGGTDEE